MLSSFEAVQSPSHATGPSSLCSSLLSARTDNTALAAATAVDTARDCGPRPSAAAVPPPPAAPLRLAGPRAARHAAPARGSCITTLYSAQRRRACARRRCRRSCVAADESSRRAGLPGRCRRPVCRRPTPYLAGRSFTWCARCIHGRRLPCARARGGGGGGGGGGTARGGPQRRGSHGSTSTNRADPHCRRWCQAPLPASYGARPCSLWCGNGENRARRHRSQNRHGEKTEISCRSGKTRLNVRCGAGRISAETQRSEEQLLLLPRELVPAAETVFTELFCTAGCRMKQGG